MLTAAKATSPFRRRRCTCFQLQCEAALTDPYFFCVRRLIASPDRGPDMRRCDTSKSDP